MSVASTDWSASTPERACVIVVIVIPAAWAKMAGASSVKLAAAHM
jgi:hypothetical protein